MGWGGNAPSHFSAVLLVARVGAVGIEAVANEGCSYAEPFRHLAAEGQIIIINTALLDLLTLVAMGMRRKVRRMHDWPSVCELNLVTNRPSRRSWRRP